MHFRYLHNCLFTFYAYADIMIRRDRSNLVAPN